MGVAYLRPIDMADQFRIYTLHVSTCGHGNAVRLGLLRGAENFWQGLSKGNNTSAFACFGGPLRFETYRTGLQSARCDAASGFKTNC